MTSDELRARVERFVVEECKGRWPAVSLIESLCREMIAEGLERAAVIVWDESDGDIDLARWKCRQEAQRVKEGI